MGTEQELDRANQGQSREMLRAQVLSLSLVDQDYAREFDGATNGGGFSVVEGAEGGAVYQSFIDGKPGLPERNALQVAKRDQPIQMISVRMTVDAAVFYLDTDVLRHDEPAWQAAKNALRTPGGV